MRLFQLGHNARYRWMKGNRAVDVHGRVYVVLCQFSKVLWCSTIGIGSIRFCSKKTHAIKMARFSGTMFTPSSIIQGTGGATRTTGRRRESLVRHRKHIWITRPVIKKLLTIAEAVQQRIILKYTLPIVSYSLL